MQREAPLKTPVTKTSRKWAQVLGIPDQSNVMLEKQRIRKLARKRGANAADVAFMLEQIVRLVQDDSKLPKDAKEEGLALT